ncbi:hypothetical protein CLV78_102565 [Aliiruegeria haliotis]|uniref:Uncharacterized protein n=1 Tax=Aliiruegeria haliotis TaxID=1280846 RepID=A0A2T0RW61_9RHOB|nr:hypothetical protein [Aliiruegeria haliotis]PRY25387.1 hypothetical protein CLV78_102565 [Aliiruegeria haliotis]
MPAANALRIGAPTSMIPPLSPFPEPDVTDLAGQVAKAVAKATALAAPVSKGPQQVFDTRLRTKLSAQPPLNSIVASSSLSRCKFLLLSGSPEGPNSIRIAEHPAIIHFPDRRNTP